MKILYIITRANEIGGAQTHLRDMTSALVNDDHHVELIVGEQGALVDELSAMNVKVHVIPELVREISPYKDIKSALIIRKIIKEFSPDVIALHSSKAGIVGRLASLFLNVPVVFTVHGWSFANGVNNNKRRFYILIERLFSKITDEIITVSAQDKKLAIEHNVASASQQTVIHNGVPLKNHAPHVYRNNAVVKLISVARFSEQKDHESLLKALSLLETKNWTLTLVGKGPRLDEMKQLSRDLGISEKIIFTGERLDVDFLLADSDIFLLISNWEGFPISILEAMREGLPVLASDVGGVSESVIDGQTGYLVPRADVNAIKNGLNNLINDSSLRAKFGKSGNDFFQENFSFNAMYKKTVELYRKAIKQKQIK
ncbi:group 1 glycosyl transferase [Enterobacter hormaechei]|uniref:glycosyltransferase family 4 protein n=1 Tax=Enterobacter hormaechei TaxID=158836 RepID=UPI0012563A9B|nr:glycosyltransferase family 4 protein [Enterobacter hormaechei]VAE42689.1 group 1 glycosyl transferase [Enterobacter hormaechei]VAM29641.1 group 1 glycosyl transferase [Enterobacter hormaechei]